MYGGREIRSYEVSDPPFLFGKEDTFPFAWHDYRTADGGRFETAVKPDGAIVAFKRRSFAQKVTTVARNLSGDATEIEPVAIAHDLMFQMSPEAQDLDLLMAVIDRRLERFERFTDELTTPDRSEIETLLVAHRAAVAKLLEIGREDDIQPEIVASYRSGDELSGIEFSPGERRGFFTAPIPEMRR